MKTIKALKCSCGAAQSTATHGLSEREGRAFVTAHGRHGAITGLGIEEGPTFEPPGLSPPTVASYAELVASGYALLATADQHAHPRAFTDQPRADPWWSTHLEAWHAPR
jgi:hypothetical protein